MKKLASSAVVATVGAAALVGVLAGPAAAGGSHPGTCQMYDVCYFWDDNLTGSQAGVWGQVADVANPWLTFQTAGGGQGQGLSNNAGSISNLDYQLCQTIYEDENFGGRTNSIWKNGRLTGWFITKNNNRANSAYTAADGMSTREGGLGMKRLVGRAAVAGALALAAVVGLSGGQAMASGAHSTCQMDDICYFWDDNGQGSRVGMWGMEVADVMNPWITFQTAGGGQGQGIGNNAGSIGNWDSGFCVTVFEDEYFGGRTNSIWKNGSLTGWFVTKNNNRAHRFYGC
ncbi:peptidase inhibitor family I36 protein [Kitasatospora sp. Root107]|nr:peptidase inhibitor family I36 protein [Kitasatospora sp. Root107]